VAPPPARGKAPLKVMISGAPASGKGTQCRMIVEKVKCGTAYSFPFALCGCAPVPTFSPVSIGLNARSISVGSNPFII